ncbi:putative RNA methyltransferase [Nocardia crassostreae]|uniref:putative RNA methyltransferase n=1 Tax=Nocardia crassostreae TaxID=53428 RepID=UPI003F75A53C
MSPTDLDRLTGTMGKTESPPAERLIACADLLSCPECGSDISVTDRTLRCPRGHTFDLARQGYVSLLTGAATKMTGDTPAMLDARAAFQSAGHFAPIAAALAHAVAAELPSARSHRDAMTRPGATAVAPSAARLKSILLSGAAPRRPTAGAAVLEIGAGTGYYLGAALDELPDGRGIALDVSKPAAKRAARAHSRIGSVLADAWRGLPVRDGVLDAVLCVFAPRNADEVARVLRPEGRFIVVTPTSRHLTELIEPLGMVSVDAAKDDRLADSLGERFELLERQDVEYAMSLTRADVAHVAGMGPSAHHAAAERADRIAALPDPMAVTASVRVTVYRVRG